jgi:tetratricopeptide (TPR) repeat protein
LLFCLLSLSCVQFGAAAAEAQEQSQGIIQMQENQIGDDQRAKAHFRVGTTLYDAGRFNEAAEEWQKAFDLSQRAELLYNVYVAYRDASSGDKAIEALRHYLELGEIEPTRRLQLEARLRAAEEAQTGQAAPAEPTTSTEPASAAPVASESTGTRGGIPKIVPITLMAAGGALLVASVITGLMVNGVEGDLEDSCPNNLCPDDVDLDGKLSTGNTLIALNAITGVVGVLSLGTGVVLFLMSNGDDTPPATSALNFGCTVDGCGGQFSGQF